MAEIKSIKPKKGILEVVFSGAHTDIKDLPDDIERIENERRHHAVNRVLVDLREVTGRLKKTEEKILYDILNMWSETRIAFVFSADPKKMTFNKPPKKLGLDVGLFDDVEEAAKWLNSE
jgi:hypothetical protein